MLFLDNNNLLSNTQFTYLKGTSTDTALHNIIDNLLFNIDKGNISAACMLDLTKGFDTICHDILLYKLHYYGKRGNSQSNGIPRTRVRVPVEMHVFHISSIGLIYTYPTVYNMFKLIIMCLILVKFLFVFLKEQF